MSKLTTALLVILSTSALATEVHISSEPFGSGSPGGNQAGYEAAGKVAEGVYHAPQYMPGYPTAAVIYPRVIEVQCDHNDKNVEVVECDGYHWKPEYGRGEYLFFTRAPVVEAPVPIVIEKTTEVQVPVVVEKEKRVYVEVETKKPRE